MRRPKKTVTINLADYLSAGTYNVKVKSKGTDIRDSEDSNSVECVVAASGYEVTITLQNCRGGDWVSTRIYSDFEVSNGNVYLNSADQIGSIGTMNGTATVTTTGKLFIYARTNGLACLTGSLTQSSSITIDGTFEGNNSKSSGNLSSLNINDDVYVDNVKEDDYICGYMVSATAIGNGTITISGIDFSW